MIVAIYATDSGRITKIVECSEEIISHQLEEGEGWVEVKGGWGSIGDDTHYVESGEFKGKLTLTPAVTSVGLLLTVSAIPAGSLVIVGGAEVVADDQPTEIEFDASGTYEIRIYPPPQYRDEVLEVTVG